MFQQKKFLYIDKILPVLRLYICFCFSMRMDILKGKLSSHKVNIQVPRIKSNRFGLSEGKLISKEKNHQFLQRANHFQVLVQMLTMEKKNSKAK